MACDNGNFLSMAGLFLHASGIYLEYTRTCLEWNEFHTNMTVYLMFLEPRCMLRTNSKGATFSSRLQNSWSSVYYETAMDFFTGDTALVRCPDNFSFLSSIRRNNGSHAIIQCGVQTPGTWLPDFVTTLPSCVYVSLSRFLTNVVYRYCMAVNKQVDNLSCQAFQDRPSCWAIMLLYQKLFHQ